MSSTLLEAPPYGFRSAVIGLRHVRHKIQQLHNIKFDNTTMSVVITIEIPT